MCDSETGLFVYWWGSYADMPRKQILAIGIDFRLNYFGYVIISKAL